MPIEEVVERIARLNQGLYDFWGAAEGWAPIEAANLLSRSRLDRQVSLSKCIHIWLQQGEDGDEEGRLILAWTNLGALIEGTLKLYLSVWYRDYLADADPVTRRGEILQPDVLQLERLRQFLNKRGQWETKWDKWAGTIQQRRNAIHAYKDQDIGNMDEFCCATRKYLDFLRYISGMLPYPDDVYMPWET